MKHEETVSHIQTHYTCDECGAKQSYYMKCTWCKKDLCQTHVIYQFNDPFTGDHLGDYPYKSCQKCSVEIKPYQEKATKLRLEFETKIEQIEEEFRNR